MDAATGMKLEECVKRYGENKDYIKPYEKEIKEDNDTIKKIMKENKIKTFPGGDYEATYRIDVTEDFDYDKLVQVIHYHWREKGHGDEMCPYLKVKFEVDMPALENAIYNGDFDAKLLANCKVRKETPKLIINKIKKEKKDE